VYCTVNGSLDLLHYLILPTVVYAGLYISLKFTVLMLGWTPR